MTMDGDRRVEVSVSLQIAAPVTEIFRGWQPLRTIRRLTARAA